MRNYLHIASARKRAHAHKRPRRTEWPSRAEFFAQSIYGVDFCGNGARAKLERGAPMAHARRSMQRIRRAIPTIALLLSASAGANVPTPSEFLKFEVGSDRRLADYHQIVSY